MNKATIQELLDQSKEQDEHKTDYIAHPHAMKFDQNCIMQVEPGGLFMNGTVALSPNEWAYRQIFSKLGTTVFGKGVNKTLPADYMMALRPDLRAYVLNDHLKNYPNGDWFVRAYDDTCRAVLSDRYAAIGNTELLTILSAVTNEAKTPSHLTNSSSVNQDSLNVRIIWKDVNRGDDSKGNGKWGIGVAITNGETGKRRLRGMPLLQRDSCDNSIILDGSVNGFEFTHRGSINTKMIVVKSAMQEILPFAAELLETMIAAESQSIPDFSSVLAGLAIQYGWDDKQAAAVAIGTEGRETRAGIVNGVTHSAKLYEDADARMDIEILGGRILVAPDSIFSQAAKVYQTSEKL
jgi:hypothetical protein